MPEIYGPIPGKPFNIHSNEKIMVKMFMFKEKL